MIGTRVPELAKALENPDPTSMWNLGVIEAVDFRTYDDAGLRKAPLLQVRVNDTDTRPMAFVGSITEYSTGQTVMWADKPGTPIVIGPIPIKGARPEDPSSLEPYQAATLQNSWAHWGAPQSTPAFYKQNDGWVRLKGSVKNGSSATATIFTLPVGYRPPFDVYVSTISDGTSAQITIATTGTVSMPAGGGTGHVSLDGIVFPASWNQAAWKNVRMQNDWDWNILLLGSVPEIFIRDDGWCWQKGSITPGTGNAVWAEYPQECYGRSWGFIFSCFNANGFFAPVQMDLHYSGEGVYREVVVGATVVGGLSWFGALSVGVVNFTVMSLVNGWTTNVSAGTPVRPPLPGYYKDHFGVVHLQGVVNGSAKSSDVLFTLPVGYRPAENQIFMARDALTVGIARVDVQSNGNVVRVSGNVGGTGRFSLNQVSFRAEQ